MAVRPIPEGYHTATPYLIVRGAARAIDFYTKAFGATELMRMAMPGDKIGHAELRVGDSRIMLADEHPEVGAVAPTPGSGGAPFSILLYVPDVDATFARALANGAKETRAVKDQVYGDRMGTLTDPFGHVWSVATHIEDVSPEEIRRRYESSPKHA